MTKKEKDQIFQETKEDWLDQFRDFVGGLGGSSPSVERVSNAAYLAKLCSGVELAGDFQPKALAWVSSTQIFARLRILQQWQSYDPQLVGRPDRNSLAFKQGRVWRVLDDEELRILALSCAYGWADMKPPQRQMARAAKNKVERHAEDAGLTEHLQELQNAA